MAAPCVRRGPTGAGVFCAAGGATGGVGRGRRFRRGVGAGAARGAGAGPRAPPRAAMRLLHQLLHLGRAAREQHRLREPDARAVGAAAPIATSAAHLGEELAHASAGGGSGSCPSPCRTTRSISGVSSSAVSPPAGRDDLALRSPAPARAASSPPDTGGCPVSSRHQDAAEAVGVRALVDQLALGLLRRQVLGDAEDRLGHRRPAPRS